MKRWRKQFSAEQIKSIMAASAVKLLTGTVVFLLWNILVNRKSIAPSVPAETGCFFLSVYCFVWAWLQYLILDGVRSLDFLRAGDDEDGEETMKRLCSDLVCGLVFLGLGIK